MTEDVLILTVRPEEYMDKLVEYCMVKVYSMIRVVDTNQTWTEEDDFVMDKPRLEMEVTKVNMDFSTDVDIKLMGEAKRKRLCKVKVTFTNPLPIALTECFFMLEAPGILREVVFIESLRSKSLILGKEGI